MLLTNPVNMLFVTNLSVGTMIYALFSIYAHPIHGEFSNDITIKEYTFKYWMQQIRDFIDEQSPFL